eukprot:590700-Rhodomonas_salina.2
MEASASSTPVRCRGCWRHRKRTLRAAQRSERGTERFTGKGEDRGAHGGRRDGVGVVPGGGAVGR